jgi:chaperonin GroES
MLTPFVLALAFANGLTATFAYPYAALIGALRIPEDQNFFARKIFFGAEVLTLREPAPTRFAGCAGGAGRPFDIDGLSKEEFMNFRPLHDRVLVRRIEADEKTAGGIIIPDTAKEKPSQGEVIAVGPGGRDEAGKLIPIDIKAGDRVLFGKWSGTEVKIDGEDLLIMKESDILGIVEDAGKLKKAA